MTAAPPKRQSIDPNSLLARIQTHIVERSAVGIKRIGCLFRIADENNDRTIDLHNGLPKLMGILGIVLNKAKLNKLIRLLDRGGSGGISYDEFL
jgi:Ca2+-binding EF-hand superfamily protein